MDLKVDDLSKARSQFLEAVRRIVLVLFQRDRLERYELCPEAVEEPTKVALEKLAALRVRIAKLASEMCDIEQKAGKKLGALALFGAEPEPPVRLAVALLTGKALSDSVASRVMTVGELAQFCVGNSCPDDLLIVRRAFARGGILRPHCVFQMGRSLDETRRLYLCEKSLGIALALPASEALEFEVLAERGWKGVE